MILCSARSLFHTIQLLRDDPVWCMFQFSHRMASTQWFCVVHVFFFTPYSFYAMILCGACFSFRTVQLIRYDPVWCMFQFSHRTASTRWFCVVHFTVFAPYSLYTMILCGACSCFHTVWLLHNDSVWCMFSFSHRTASTRWFCVVHVPVFAPYSFYIMILCGTCSSFRTV